MKRFALAVGASLLLGYVFTHAQASSRLEVHGELVTEPQMTEGLNSTRIHVTAICDTGNGTMIYVGRAFYREGFSLAIQPGGCAKRNVDR